MAKRILIFTLALTFLCIGCSSKKQPPGWPVVSKITLSFEQNGHLTHRAFTDPAKMRQILNHLRNLGQKFTPPVDPEALSADSCSICVAFTDGSRRFYHIKSDRYVRLDNAPWQQVDPERILNLGQLFQTLPCDMTPSGL